MAYSTLPPCKDLSEITYTIEDTELTKEQIAEVFGVQVANQVMDLTRIKENGIKISAAETVEMHSTGQF